MICYSRKRKTPTGSVSLPEEIIHEEVLLRLPLESLIRFQLVSKCWKTLISDPKFAQSHLNNLTQNPPKDDFLIVNTSNHIKNIQRRSIGDPCSYISIISRINLSEGRVNEVPYPITTNDVHLIGSVNGLVCIVCLSILNYQFMIWNPALHQIKKISPPKSCDHEKYYYGCLFAFGWESMPNDYKLIVKLPRTLQCYIYSTKRDSWTKILVSKHYLNLPQVFSEPSIVVKGFPYWSWNRKSILKFDVEKNDFRFIQFSSSNVQALYCKAINWNDCLARTECIGGYHVDVYRLDNEECQMWSKMYSIDFKTPHWPSMCFKYGGEIVLAKKNLYDHSSKQIKNILYDKEGWFLNGFSYTPSLVLIKGMKKLHEQGPLLRAS